MVGVLVEGEAEGGVDEGPVRALNVVLLLRDRVAVEEEGVRDKGEGVAASLDVGVPEAGEEIVAFRGAEGLARGREARPIRLAAVDRM